MQNLQVLLLHEHPQYLADCCTMINEEWPRSATARMMSLLHSGDQLPTNLVLINDKKALIGHCKLTPLPSTPESCFLETVVIRKGLRGQKLGTYLMSRVEDYCKNTLNLKTIHLSTKGQEVFYAKLGYEVCAPVSIYGHCANSYKSQDGHIKQETGPIISPKLAFGAPPPPPPPPPPMPKNNNVTIKTSKTYMVKVL